jgi:hypothetical protein
MKAHQPSAAIIVGFDPAIHLSRKMIDARVKPPHRVES